MISKKTLTIIIHVLWFLFALYFAESFIKNGYRKFDAEGFWAPAFSRWGYAVWFMYFIGVLEFVAGILILIPARIGGYGAITLAVVMVGAFVTRSIHGASSSDLFSIAFFAVSMLILFFHRGGDKLILRRG